MLDAYSQISFQKVKITSVLLRLNHLVKLWGLLLLIYN